MADCVLVYDLEHLVSSYVATPAPAPLYKHKHLEFKHPPDDGRQHSQVSPPTMRRWEIL